MGHRLLGKLPQTRNWKKVIALLSATDDPAAIARETSKAASRGLNLAKSDPGVIDAVYTLISTTLAANKSDFQSALEEIGISIPKEASLLDVVGAFNKTLDQDMLRRGHRSDLAEMARQAAVETLTEMCSKETGSLFGVTMKDTQQTLKKYSTPTNFGLLGESFFGKFLFRFLDYHLSRELPNHIGSKKQFQSIRDCQIFKEALNLHCLQTARIVREFSGGWQSSTEYHEGVTRNNVGTKFVPVAFKKITDELKLRGGAND